MLFGLIIVGFGKVVNKLGEKTCLGLANVIGRGDYVIVTLCFIWVKLEQ